VGRHRHDVDPSDGSTPARVASIDIDRGLWHRLLQGNSSTPGVVIYTPVIDRELNAHKFIVPGLGDFGDRLYGTV
jgi:hypothetical protein